MNALMDLISKSSNKSPSTHESGEGESASGNEMNPAFESAAQETMDALQSGDSAGFADALKACIEMAQG